MLHLRKPTLFAINPARATTETPPWKLPVEINKGYDKRTSTINAPCWVKHAPEKGYRNRHSNEQIDN
jgi:hypothetical protein